ncbi:MAG: hypothetical protein BMS9Abin37_0644 [Acidobacteriota bacterium]|nr:MAG: hypothetical protein BMS9Abin37_0644 [Acidobacteriota bacterium]
MSVLLRPQRGDRDRVALLPHLSAVAAAEAVIETTALDVRLRWPNDLYTNGLKLGGILCEGSFRGAEAETFVVGIGINVNQRVEDFPADVRRRATVLSEHALGTLEGRDVAARVVTRLETWWRLGEPPQILAKFKELAEGATGRAIQVQPRGTESEPFEAVTRGIADDGGLIVALDDGQVRILYSEDVTQLRDGDDRSR